jgi:GR25 family glycosyltransferase involved in LPS biosynthesis
MHINDERKNNRDQISSIVNGNLLPIETINAKKDNGIEDFMFKNPKFIFAPNGFKNGEKGNFASHYTAWKYLLSTDLENILIFEDDAILHSDFVSKYSLAMSNVPEGYDVLSLFAHENQEPRCLDSHYINDFISKAYQDWSTLSYVVSRQGAKKMIEYVESIGADDPTDWFIFRKGHSGMFNVYTISPTFGSPLKIDTQYVSQVQL